MQKLPYLVDSLDPYIQTWDDSRAHTLLESGEQTNPPTHTTHAFARCRLPRRQPPLSRTPRASRAAVKVRVSARGQPGQGALGPSHLRCVFVCVWCQSVCNFMPLSARCWNVSRSEDLHSANPVSVTDHRTCKFIGPMFFSPVRGVMSVWCAIDIGWDDGGCDSPRAAPWRKMPLMACSTHPLKKTHAHSIGTCYIRRWMDDCFAPAR